MEIDEFLHRGQNLLVISAEDLIAFADKLLSERKELAVKQGPEKPLTQIEAIQFLGKSRQTLHKWRRMGIVRAYTINGRLYYKPSELLAALKKADNEVSIS